MAKMMTFTTKIFIAMCFVYLSGLGTILIVRCYCPWNDTDAVVVETKQSLQEFRNSRPAAPVSEVYVISLEESKFNIFEQRNSGMFSEEDDDDGGDENTTVEWFQGYNGTDQAILDEFAKTTGLFRINAGDYEGLTPQKSKDAYASPHSVGVYLSHWRLLEKVYKSWGKKRSEKDRHKRRKRRRPDMLFVFEDDAMCVSKTIDRVWKVVQQLPEDWDILYASGKPFSYHTNGKSLGELAHGTEDTVTVRPSDQQLMNKMCKGEFGTSTTGPFAAGTSKADPIQIATGATETNDPPYWQTKYILNTNAYVINPKSLKRVLRVLSAPMSDYVPVDVTYAYELSRDFFDPNAYESDVGPASPLKGYLTPHVFCDQETQRMIINRNQPADWAGYQWMPWKTFKNFPGAKSFVWGSIANKKTCRSIWNATKK